MSSPAAERLLHDTGLRRISQHVSSIIASRKRVSYSDVADDVILELRRTGTTVVVAAAPTGRAARGDASAAGEDDDGGGVSFGAGAGATRSHTDAEKGDAMIDDRTVRLRVYDSLNVLAALGHIVKVGKTATYSTPANALVELAVVAESLERVAAAVSTKRAIACDLIFQQLALRRLVATNIAAEKDALRQVDGGAAAGAAADLPVSAAAGVCAVPSVTGVTGAAAAEVDRVLFEARAPPGNIALPFLLLAAPATARLRIYSASGDGPPSSADVVLDDVYELKEHAELLRLLSLADFSVSELRSAVPSALYRIVLRPTAEPPLDLATARDGVGSPVRGADALRAAIGGVAAENARARVSPSGHGGAGVGAGDESMFVSAEPSTVRSSFLPSGVAAALLESWGSSGGAAEQAAALLARNNAWPTRTVAAACAARGRIAIIGLNDGVDRGRVATLVVGTLRGLGGLALANAHSITSECIRRAVVAAEAALPALPESAVAAMATRTYVVGLVSATYSVFSNDAVVQCASAAQAESTEALERTAAQELVGLTAHFQTCVHTPSLTINRQRAVCIPSNPRHPVFPGSRAKQPRLQTRGTTSTLISSRRERSTTLLKQHAQWRFTTLRTRPCSRQLPSSAAAFSLSPPKASMRLLLPRRLPY